MSTPPVQPPNSNEPEPGAQPPAPRYGENAPPSGQPTPEYGQNAPQYGQNAPQYGQNAPQYGQNAPQYGQNAPQYGQNPPQFGAPGSPAPQYGQNPPAYGQAPAYGQQPFGQQYGQSPYAQYPSEQPQATGSNAVPPQVDLAFKLIVAAGILSAVSSLALAFTGGDYFLQLMEQQLQSQGQDLPAGSAEGIQGAMVVGSIIGAIVSLGLYALVAFPVRKGKNWARILGTVFAAISVLGLFGGVFTFGPVYGILQILVILLGVAGIVLLYLPANSPYFQKQQPFANPYGQPGNPYGR
jgi:hypothetical protein